MTHAPVWTQGGSYADMEAALDASRPGASWTEWRESLHAILPQAGLLRRKDILEFARRHGVDGQDRVQSTRFLTLFHDGSPHRRRTLVHGRVAFGIPLVHAAVDFLGPWRGRLGEPLVPEDASIVPETAWTGWLADSTGKDPSTETARRSLSNTISHLVGCGCLHRQSIRPRITRIQRAEPDRLAAAWLIAHELRMTGRAEASEPSLVRDSFAARLFCLPEQVVAGILEEGVAAGLLSRTYLMGVPRYHPLPDIDA